MPSCSHARCANHVLDAVHHRFEHEGSSFRPQTLQARMKSAAICRLFDTYIHPIQVKVILESAYAYSRCVVVAVHTCPCVCPSAPPPPTPQSPSAPSLEHAPCLPSICTSSASPCLTCASFLPSLCVCFLSWFGGEKRAVCTRLCLRLGSTRTGSPPSTTYRWGVAGGGRRGFYGIGRVPLKSRLQRAPLHDRYQLWFEKYWSPSSKHCLLPCTTVKTA